VRVRVRVRVRVALLPILPAVGGCGTTDAWRRAPSMAAKAASHQLTGILKRTLDILNVYG